MGEGQRAGACVRVAWGVAGVVILLMALAVAPRVAYADDGVEQRIAAFWQRVNALQPTDHVSSADLGQWALNVIDRDSRTRLTVADFRAATAAMQAAFDRDGPAPIAPPQTTLPTPRPGSPPQIGTVEDRIAAFWQRINGLQPTEYISSSDIGQWALNVIQRDARTRLTASDFRSSTAAMQVAFDRAGLAPSSAPKTPTPSTTPSRTAVSTALATLTVSGAYRNLGSIQLLRGAINAGRFLELSDASVWEVSSFDRFQSRFWFRYADVVVSLDPAGLLGYYLVTNLDERETVSARLLRVTRLSIATKSLDGSLVTLSDRTTWKIDSFDSYETILWGSFDEVAVVDDFLGYRMVNLTDRSAASVTRVTASSPTLAPITLRPVTLAPLTYGDPCGAPSNPWGYSFCGGSYIYFPPSSFCLYFTCIASFWNGTGYVMQCADGEFSLSGGHSGSCSYHLGNRQPLYSR